MSVNRTHISKTRTLLIILGIVLAFLLTLNASSLFTADIPSKKEEIQEKLDSPSNLNGKIEKAGIGFIQIYLKNLQL